MTTEAPTDRELAELKHQVERDERDEKRRARGAHAAKYMRWDLATRDLKARCGYCGRRALDGSGSRHLARDWVSDSALGHISVGRCAVCVALYRSHALGTIALNADTLTISKALAKAGLAEYNPGKALTTRKLAGLSWASFAYRARVAGADDPGDPTKAFDHLAGLQPSVIDFDPPMPEPSMPRRLTGI